MRFSKVYTHLCLIALHLIVQLSAHPTDLKLKLAKLLLEAENDVQNNEIYGLPDERQYEAPENLGKNLYDGLMKNVQRMQDERKVDAEVIPADVSVPHDEKNVFVAEIGVVEVGQGNEEANTQTNTEVAQEDNSEKENVEARNEDNEETISTDKMATTEESDRDVTNQTDEAPAVEGNNREKDSKSTQFDEKQSATEQATQDKVGAGVIETGAEIEGKVESQTDLTEKQEQPNERKDTVRRIVIIHSRQDGEDTNQSEGRVRDLVSTMMGFWHGLMRMRNHMLSA